MKIQIYFMLFITYAIIGWILETTYVFIGTKKLYNRGFMVGPYIPIYGVGCLLITILLSRYQDSVFGLFCMSMVICSLLEYFTSYIMEKLFKTRWWDYSKRRYNINGRICLETMVPFGLVSLIVIYFLNPFFIDLYETMNPTGLNILCIIIAIIFMTDFIFSLIVVSGYSKTLKNIKAVNKDATQDINQYIKDLFTKKSYFSRRLVKAFPNMKVVDKIKKKLQELVEEQKAEKKETVNK